MGLTICFVAAIAVAAGYRLPQSVFFGFLMALSSTAIVMKLIQQRAEVTTHHGQTALGILIYQDIIIVPMMLMIPILAGKSAAPGGDLLLLVGKTAGLIMFVYIGARWLVPWLLHEIAKTQSRELFLLSILMLGLAVAWLTASMGLSLALGAFLAGLTISESEYSHEAFGNIMPVRDIFTSFFFLDLDPKTEFKADDILFLMGNRYKMTCATPLFKGAANPSVKTPQKCLAVNLPFPTDDLQSWWRLCLPVSPRCQ